MMHDNVRTMLRNSYVMTYEESDEWSRVEYRFLIARVYVYACWKKLNNFNRTKRLMQSH